MSNLITQLAQNAPETMITVTAADLTAAFRDIYEIARKDMMSGVQAQYQSKTMSRKQVAEMFGVTFPTLSNWAAAGILQPRKIGGKLFYETAEVLALKSKKFEVR